MAISVQGRDCVKGIDVSNWQHGVDYGAVRDAGVAFVVAKATEGTGYVDPWFTRNRAGALGAGLVFGAYHWLKPDQPPRAQADNFLATVDNGAGCSFLVLDAEESGITDSQVTLWCQYVEAAGLPIVIYCGAHTDPRQRSDAWLSHTPWLAAYPGGYSMVDPDPAALRPPINPDPWGRWDIWQYSSIGRVPGVIGNCDVNVADAAWFASLANGSTPPPPATILEEDDMSVFQTALHEGRGELWLLWGSPNQPPIYGKHLRNANEVAIAVTLYGASDLGPQGALIDFIAPDAPPAPVTFNVDELASAIAARLTGSGDDGERQAQAKATADEIFARLGKA